MRSLHWLLLVYLGHLANCNVLAASETSRPNVVFILADDLGYGDLGCYGCDDISTPHLDELAAEGLRFTDFYANGAVCSPTRAAFLTGRYQDRLGMSNAIYYQEAGVGLPTDGLTIADALSDAGYVTGLSGKWHLGYDYERRPLQQGFQHFFGLLGGNHHYFTHVDRVGVDDLWLGNGIIQRQGYTTDLTTDDAITFIEKNRKRPFFLYLSHAAPHFPWQGPSDREKVVEPKKKSWQIGDRKTYAAMVERMDHGIGRVLETLESLGLRDQTLVVFTSDNGGHTWSRNAPLRDFKGTLWEGGIRVPCIARWPKVIEAGQTTSQVGITMDWTTTFRRLASLPIDPAGEDGVDLRPILEQPSQVTSRKLFWRRRKDARRKKVVECQAVRDGRWKLIEFVDGDRQLFDLQSDIGEQDNLIARHASVADRLSAELAQWMTEVQPTKSISNSDSNGSLAE